MPRLPTLDNLGERQTPRASSTVVPLRPVFDDTQERNAKALSVAAAMLERQQESIDKAAAEEAFNALREKEADLTFGEKNGYRNLKGGQAVNEPFQERYLGLYDQSAKLVEDTLQTPRQKELFRARAQGSRVAFGSEMNMHRLRELPVYEKNVYDSSVSSALDTIGKNFDNPHLVNAEIARASALADERAAKLGIPELAEQEKRGIMDRARTAQLEAERMTNPLGALARYQSVSADMSPELSRKVGEALFKDAARVLTEQLAQNPEGPAKAVFERLPEDQQLVVKKGLHDAAQRRAFNDYQSAFIGAREDRKSLSALEARVANDPNLDEDRKNTLLGRIASRSEMLDRRAEMATMRWERNVERQLTAARDEVLAGGILTPESAGPLLSATKGTAFEGEVRGLIGLSNATNQFRLAPFAQQADTIARAEAAWRENPAKMDRRVVNAFKSIHEAQRTQVRDDPINFAVRQGLAEPVALDISKPADMGPQLQSRYEIATAMRGRYQAPMMLLTKDEAATLSTALKDAPVAQKREYLSALSTATAGNRDAYRSIMAQLAPDDPVTAMAGAYASGLSQQRRQASDLMLRGQAILNPVKTEDGRPTGGKLIPMPPDADMQRDFSDITQTVFAGKPQAGSGYFQAAKAIYAAKSADAGDTGGKLDGRRWREAVELATGRVETYRGKPIILPENYDIGRFRDALASHVQGLEASGRLEKGVTRQKLMDLPLENRGDGRYVFRAGDAVLVDKDGRPVEVTFR